MVMLAKGKFPENVDELFISEKFSKFQYGCCIIVIKV